MAVFLLILGIVLFVGLVVVHEFGHFIVARRNGVEAEEFGIGFPPRAWSRKLGSGLLFSINWLPIGGFVKLKGEHDSDTAPGTFGAASLMVKAKIMLAGVGMNLLAAFVLLTVLAWAGMPQLVGNQFTVKRDSHTANQRVFVGQVESGSPASHAGLRDHDQIIGAWTGRVVGCNYLVRGASNPPDCSLQVRQEHPDTTFLTAQDLTHFTKSHAGQPVTFMVSRGGRRLVTPTVTLLTAQTVAASQKANTPKGYLGVAPEEFSLTRSTWSAPIVAAGLIKQFTVLTVQGLGHALGGLGSTLAGLATGNKSARQAGQAEATGEVSGPVGIVVVLHDTSLLGYQYVLLVIAIISLTLAIMNVLPIPALDGGRLFLLLIARLLKKPLTQENEERIVGAGFAVLMLLVVLITIVDVKRFF